MKQKPIKINITQSNMLIIPLKTGRRIANNTIKRSVQIHFCLNFCVSKKILPLSVIFILNLISMQFIYTNKKPHKCGALLRQLSNYRRIKILHVYLYWINEFYFRRTKHTGLFLHLLCCG